jgi:hypothetical protein
MYDAVVTAALNQMYEPKAFPILCQKLKESADNISAGIGHSGAMILKSIKGAAEKQGKSIPDDVLFSTADEVIGQLCDIAVGIKVLDPKGVQKVAEAAMYEGVRVWGLDMQRAGKIDDNVAAQANADLDEAGVARGEPAPAQPPQGGPPPGPPAAGIANQGVA